MTIQETVKTAAAMMFEPETVAVVHGVEIGESAAGFHVAGEIVPTIREALAVGSLIGLGMRVRSAFDAVGPTFCDDDASVIRYSDCFPAA